MACQNLRLFSSPENSRSKVMDKKSINYNPTVIAAESDVRIEGNSPAFVWSMYLISLVFAALLLGKYVLARAIDGDEGIYQYAAQLVHQGELPFRDFVYPQAPMLLYFFELTSDSLIGSRALSVFFALLSLTMTFKICNRFDPFSATLAVLLQTTNYLFLSWCSVFKSYGFTMGISSALLWLLLKPDLGRVRACIVGILAAFLVGSRLLYILFPGIAFLLIHRHSERGWGVSIWCLVGIVVGFLPLALIAIQAPAQFYFGLVGIHQVRSHFGMVGNFNQKWSTIIGVVSDRQFCVLIFLGIIGLFARKSKVQSVMLPFTVALFLTSCLPTPTYVQYFTCLIPQLVVLAVIGARSLGQTNVGKFFLGILCLYYFGNLMERNLPTASFGPGDVNVIADCIRKHANKNETILAFYPGYAAWSHTRVPPELANNFAYLFSSQLTLAQLRRYKIADADDVRNWIIQRRFGTVILGSNVVTEEVRFRQLLEVNGYHQDMACEIVPIFTTREH